MSWPIVLRRESGRWLVVGMIMALSACAHALLSDAPLVDRVLGEKVLREQLVERGSADEHFVHEILHQLGQGPDGDQKFARLLAEHLGHHPTAARAVFRALATSREFEDWLIERLRDRKETP